MQFIAKIVDVTVETPSGKKYKQANVIYQKDGKTDTKKVIDFYLKKEAGDGAWDVITNAKKGDELLITSEKEGEYWQWKKVEKNTGGGSVGAPSGAATPRGSNYVSDDIKQRMIIRQSSISSAVNLLKDASGDYSLEVLPDMVIDIACKFEDFVYNGKKSKLGTVESFTELEDDIPL